jgi:hypothetical protein
MPGPERAVLTLPGQWPGVSQRQSKRSMKEPLVLIW